MALTLVIAMSTTCFGATWGSYFGFTDTQGEWYEASEGSISSVTSKGWKANLTSLGYGGIWGCQIFQDTSRKAGKVSVKKGQKYTLSFEMKSSNCDKLVYIKVAKGENLAFGDWIKLQRGKTHKYNVTFKAACDADAIYFGLGGEFGDRQESDVDAEKRYAIAVKKFGDIPSDEDPTYSTQITMSKYSFGATKPAKVKKLTLKATKGKITVKYGKVSGVKGYQVKYTVKGSKAKTKTTTKTTYTIKKVKAGKKVTVQVRAYLKGKVYGDWSAKKTVKAK